MRGQENRTDPLSKKKVLLIAKIELIVLVEKKDLLIAKIEPIVLNAEFSAMICL